MTLKPTPTGDSFFDPPPEDHSAATLILGGERLECHLIEVSIGGFGVSVPRSTAWTGEPVCRLLTHDAAYPVRLIKQESHYSGYHFTLQRLELDEQLGRTQRRAMHAFRCGAIGLIAAIAGCLLAVFGGGSTVARYGRPLEIINPWSWTWPSTESEQGESASIHEATSGDVFEQPATSVSLTSSQPMSVDPQTRAIAEATRLAQLKSSLQSARRGHSHPANSTSLPWLFPNTGPAVSDEPAYRMSEAARDDLIQFESELKSLPAATASDATRSLRRALLATTSASVATVTSLPEIKQVRSDDAEIYFQLVHGTVEILRVVPRDDNGPVVTARSVSPTSGLTPQSVKR